MKSEKKKTYTVKIIQTLEGYVSIDAGSEAEALEIADKFYNEQGNELPDMDDCCSLTFEISE